MNRNYTAGILVIVLASIGTVTYKNRSRSRVNNERSLQLQEKEGESKRSIAFIHIGKSAGTTAATMIRKACYRHKDPSKCLEQDIENETEISKQVNEYFHMRTVDVDKYKSFIVTVRDPIDRILSWYVYQHPINQLYENQDKALALWNCYDTVDKFGVLGLRELPDNLESMSTMERQCMHLARDAVLAKMPEYLFPHLSYNYEFYTSKLMLAQQQQQQQQPETEKEIMVLRKEHFWDDWQGINTMLGGGEITRKDSYTHIAGNSTLKYNDRTLSPEAVQNLCNVLCHEIQLYKQLIQRATNLDAGSKLKSIYNLSAKCPKEVKAKKCQSTTTRNIAFIIIGKTGGSTAALLLKKGCFSAGCRSRVIDDESEISRQVTHLYHLRPVPAHQHSSYMISTRDPIERVKAWFIYQHPKNRIYPTHPQAMKLYLCYKTIGELTDIGLRPITPQDELSANDRECMNLSKTALSGQAPPFQFPHLTYNYQYYLKEVLTNHAPEEKELFIIRFAHFWNDFQKINTDLGGKVLTKPTKLYNITVVLPPETPIAKKRLPVTDNSISQQGMANLCRVLCEEIQIYKLLITRAKNLLESDKESTLKDLYQKCPVEVTNDVCEQSSQS